ncbi:MAG: HRDC domain-containing protein [Lewinellaceae bacterium]|nr:HRDC domain-containing protein [Lewinellaceae bacterium]
MQIKIFNIQIPGGEALNEEMNVFLRSKKIISVEERVVQSGQGAFWCYSIRYVDDVTISDREKPKADYRQVLDEQAFRRFSALRDIRRKVAKDAAVPAYAVFTDEELAELAKIHPLTEAGMKSVKGIGEKKWRNTGIFPSKAGSR